MPSLELNVYLLTANCARELVDPSTLGVSFFNALPRSSPLPDVVAVSLQEIAPIAQSFLGGSYLIPYYSRIEESIRSAVLHHGSDKKFDLLHQSNVGMTALLVFVSQEFVDRVIWLESSVVGVGLWEMGNKGAAALRVGFDAGPDGEEASLTFIAAHLTHMESAVQRRNKDWESIVRNLVFTPQTAISKAKQQTAGERQPEAEQLLGTAAKPRPTGQQTRLYTATSPVFFFGDLNYRTRDRSPAPNDYLNYPQPVDDVSDPRHISQWLSLDQLNRERKANRTLHEFQETQITFAPTYKYASPYEQAHETIRTGSEPQTWHWSKHRVPSWCDRILYWTPKPASGTEPSASSYTVTSKRYDSLPIQPHSDHRPVALSAHVSLTPHLSSQLVNYDGAPFPLNPDWATVRAAARRREVVVGAGAWGIFTNEGRLCVLLPIVLALLGWIVLSRE